MKSCSLCGKQTDPGVREAQGQPSPRLVRVLQSTQPMWSKGQVVCPQCALTALEYARAEDKKRAFTLQAELNLPFPVHSPDYAYILPTPLRVRADPRYAGRGVTIAFLDSGFSPNPDFVKPINRIEAYVDATDAPPAELDIFDLPKPTPNSSWHGTMVAGIAMGNGGLSDGMYRGIASEARAVFVKTGNKRGKIGDPEIQRALEWVLENAERFNIRVINVSLGGDRPGGRKLTPLERMAEEAAEMGIVVVAACGNGGERKIVAPASAPSVIAVGGLDDQNALDNRLHGMYRSNWGNGALGTLKPDLIGPAIWVAAPMVHDTPTHEQSLFLWDLIEQDEKKLRAQLATDFARVRLTRDIGEEPVDLIRRTLRSRMNDEKFIHRHYQHVDGTSMSAPIVSAIAAQMLEANPSLNPAQVKRILCDTATPLDGVPEDQQGAGVVNGAHAIAMAVRTRRGKLHHAPISPCIGPDPEVGACITFTYINKQAARVALVGSFNNWLPREYTFDPMGDGVWRIRIALLDKGTYYYKFLVDGSSWVNDPENPDIHEDGFGGWHSVLKI
ncbi:MAG: S8 family serine peptidase [Anaerolineae bacterium]|nr:S8 family serine peptidase [Thermoflexales bacterium]